MSSFNTDYRFHERRTSVEHPPKRHLRGAGILNSGMTNGFADDPDEPATGMAGTPQTRRRPYFYTGAVEPHHLDVLSREFRGFLFTAQPSFGVGRAPY